MEKAPRKQPKKRMKARTLLLLALLCAGLAGAGLLWLRSSAPMPVIPENGEAVLLLDRPEEEIASIAIAPRDGVAYPLVRTDGGFALMGQKETALRQTVLDELLLTVTELPAENVFSADIWDQGQIGPGDFGLSPALSRVTVTYTDGEQKEVLVGNMTPDQEKPQRYCMLSGDQRLFTILWADADALLHDMNYLRDFDQPQLDASLLDRIQVSGNLSFDAYYTPSGWYMTAPFSYPLSSGRMDSLFSSIESMGFEALLGEADKLNLGDFGLDVPALTVRLTQAATVITGETTEGESVSIPVPEKEYTLLLGAETGKSGVYALWEGQVFSASNFTLGFWKSLDPETYLLQTPVNFLVNDLTGLTFSYGGHSWGYEVRMVESITENNQIATDEYGRVLYDCAVKRAGETEDMDPEAFLSWYTRLSTLSPDGKLPSGAAVSGPCRGSIVLQNDHVERTVEFYSWDALHDALAVDGTALYYVQKTWLDGLPDAP